MRSRRAGHLHGHLAMSAGTQPVHGQQGFAELPAAQEEVVLGLDPACRPEADRQDRGEVADDHHEIDQLEAADSVHDPAGSTATPSDWRRGRDLAPGRLVDLDSIAQLASASSRLGLAGHEDLAVGRHGPRALDVIDQARESHR